MKITMKKTKTALFPLTCALLLAAFVWNGCGGNDDERQEVEGHSASIADTAAGGDASVSSGQKGTVRKDADAQPKSDKVIMVVVDALRADGLGCYGYSKDTSPTIDRLAKEGILFERMHSASPWTAPSFGTFYTGVSPTVHGAGSMLARGSSKGTTLFGVTVGGIRKDLPTLPKLLPSEVRKGAIINNSFVSKELGFARGVDDFNHKIAHLTRYRTADEVTDIATKWLEEHKDGPFFLMAHYFDPHIQYGPPKKYLAQFAPDKPRRIAYPFVDHHTARDGTLKPNDAEKEYIRGLYNGEVRFTDDQIGVLIGAMEKMGLMDDTWLIITSDHGEEHFDHGSFEHGHRYEEEVVRVPFIVRAPGGKWKAGTRIADSVSHVDILPTVLDLYSVPSLPHFEGSSMLPLVDGKKRPDRTSYMEFNLFKGQQCALFDGRYKIVWDFRRNRAFMYDLKEDPRELTKLGKEHPMYEGMLERVKARREELTRQARGKVFDKGALSKEAADALKSLGYIK